MSNRLVLFFSLLICGYSHAANYELPIISDLSSYYYVPQTNFEKESKGMLSSLSYSNSSGYVESWSIFFGCRRCEWQNVILVDKKSGIKKALFDSEKKITSFFVPKESNTKANMPGLVYLTLKAGKEPTSSEFYVANLDGTNLKRISPEGKTVVSYDFDIKNKKLILMLEDKKSDENQLKEAQPYLVDLLKISEAVAMLGK